ncbi:MAG: deoxyribonuclease V [Dehalococcoidia bacterium]|nr:deoxyribonuclease V [Dehalococcoidia bacterium]MBL7125919.1 deoxyribonuclease V [Dehalococcoidales bacterium]
MKVHNLHGWQVSIPQALGIQRELAARVSRISEIGEPHFIAGVDISAGRARDMATGAVVVMDYPALNVVEVKTVNEKLAFPYIPGLLSFRESPLVLTVCEKLTVTPDLILVDGQGLAHPRRLGLACHLGLLLDTPTIGCAKSRLCGRHEEPASEPGNSAELVDNGELIGAVLRTKADTSPLYVSIGHKVDLDTAVHWVLACCRGYRIPEPLRLAHLAAGGHLMERYRIPSPEPAIQGKSW